MAAWAKVHRVVRIVYLPLIILFIVGILVQALLIGQHLFANASATPHVELGWPLAHMFAPLVFLVSLFTGGRRSFWITSIVWFADAFLQPILAAFAEEGPNTVAGYHVANALVLFALSLWLAQQAWHMVMHKPVGAPRSQPPVPRAPALQPPPARRM
ncbi:MAG TPA: hypothetical protein VM327_09830 [Candidatus Thermoplasmatota archaeon]|nr:hypothetical protein [Candidatus Thermoplasmatota archaeon]